ncbi:hypothetical protein DVH24_005086 [Malus domestica]|uniref:C2 domain-containing protein n=1 Tax=Malus domestica TaxID=3750 RepID=A0A498IGA0_MALDO|nr:hypothetical protein DVH24_005086 [Malus domestica]
MNKSIFVCKQKEENCTNSPTDVLQAKLQDSTGHACWILQNNQGTREAYKVAPMKSQAAPNQEDYKLKDTKPQLGERWPHGGLRGGGGWISSDRATSTYDLVEQMFYLYVRVEKAKDLPTNPVTGSCDPYVQVKLGNYKGKTKHFEKKTNPEWKEVFAFAKEKIQSSVLEVYVKDKGMVARDDYVGKVVFDMHEVPTRVPPDSPLAPQWYRLEDRRRDTKVRGEVMLAVWMGTQADEAFPEAWHSDAASVHGEGVFSIRSKVYVSPKLWYLRVNVIEAQDVEPHDRSQPPQAFVKAHVGNQTLKTKVSPTRTANPMWNEDLVFVAAEPFEEQLVLTVENKVSAAKDEHVGKINLPLTIFERRLDHRPVHSRWFNLEKFGFGALEGDKRHDHKFSTRVHLRVCLEGAYHVLDESTLYISDVRPTARQLWKHPIGILEAVLSWRDPRASSLFVLLCLIAAVVLYVTPFKMIALAAGIVWLRHPRFRSKLPSIPSNFFRRLPSRADSML